MVEFENSPHLEVMTVVDLFDHLSLATIIDVVRPIELNRPLIEDGIHIFTFFVYARSSYVAENRFPSPRGSWCSALGGTRDATPLLHLGNVKLSTSFLDHEFLPSYLREINSDGIDESFHRIRLRW